MKYSLMFFFTRHKCSLSNQGPQQYLKQNTSAILYKRFIYKAYPSLQSIRLISKITSTSTTKLKSVIFIPHFLSVVSSASTLLLGFIKHTKRVLQDKRLNFQLHTSSYHCQRLISMFTMTPTCCRDYFSQTVT